MMHILLVTNISLFFPTCFFASNTYPYIDKEIIQNVKPHGIIPIVAKLNDKYRILKKERNGAITGYGYEDLVYMHGTRWLIGRFIHFDKYISNEGFPYGNDKGVWERVGFIAIDTASSSAFILSIKDNKQARKYNITLYSPKKWSSDSCLIRIKIKDIIPLNNNDINLSWKWNLVTNNITYVGENIPFLSSLSSTLDIMGFVLKSHKTENATILVKRNIYIAKKNRDILYKYNSINTEQELTKQLKTANDRNLTVNRIPSVYRFQSFHVGPDHKSLIVLNQPIPCLNRMSISCVDVEKNMKVNWAISQSKLQNMLKSKILRVQFVPGSYSPLTIALLVTLKSNQDDVVVILSSFDGSIHSIIKKNEYDKSLLGMRFEDIKSSNALNSLVLFNDNNELTIREINSSKTTKYNIAKYQKYPEDFAPTKFYGIDPNKNIIYEDANKPDVIYRIKYPYDKQPKIIYSYYK